MDPDGERCYGGIMIGSGFCIMTSEGKVYIELYMQSSHKGNGESTHKIPYAIEQAHKGYGDQRGKSVSWKEIVKLGSYLELGIVKIS